MSERHVTNEPAPFAMVPEALLYDPELSDKAVRLYGVLRRHGDDPANCYPSKRRLADLMGCATSSLGRPLRELEDAGWIARVARVDATGEQTSNGYHVHLARVSSAAPAQESAGPPRSDDQAPRAPERAEREPVNDSQEREDARAAAEPLRLLGPEDTAPSFDAFWKEYPRGDGKPAAVKAWEVAIKAAPPERIMEGLAAWTAYWKARAEPEFVPWAQKWLRQQQWNAAPPALRRGQQPAGQRAPVVADRSRPSGEVAL